MGKRIIIAEQDFNAYESMREYLSDRGHIVSWAKTGQKALDACEKETPDLFFIDALAPEVSGLVACKQIKEKYGDKVKCVIISELEGEKKPDPAEGIDAYFAKPVDLTRLARLMRDLTGAAKDMRRRKPAQEPTETLPVEDMEPVPPQGNIASTHLPRVLAYYCLQKANGCLILSRDKISKRIYLRGGQPVYITSNIASESLGRYLLSKGTITLDQYSDVLERVLESRKKQGLILIEMGILSPHSLYESMEDLAKEKIVQSFSWEAGTYQFTKGKFKVGKENLIFLDLYGLILDGIRRHYNLTRLEPFFQQYKRHIPQVKDPGGEWGSALKPIERNFLSSIDGKSTMGKLVSESKLNLTETFRILFFTTMVEGIGFSGIKKATGRSRRSSSGARRRGKTQNLLDFKRLVEHTYDMLEDLDYFQVLGIGEGASDNEVRSAYMLMTKQFRPYELHKAAGHIAREKADRIFERLTDAYETLLEETRRQKYLEDLATRKRADLIEQKALDKADGKPPVAPEAKPAAPEATLASPEETPAREEKPVAPEATLASPEEVPADNLEEVPSVETEPALPAPEATMDALEVAVKAISIEEEKPAPWVTLAAPEAKPETPEVLVTPEEVAAGDLEEVSSVEIEPALPVAPEATPAPKVAMPTPPEAPVKEKRTDDAVWDAVLEAAETATTAKLNVEPETPPKAVEEAAAPPQTDAELEELPAAPPEEEGEDDIFAELSINGDELDFDLFEIGVDERASEHYVSGNPDGNGVNQEDDWLATDSGSSLDGILEEGAKITSDMANFMKGELKYQQGEHLLEEGEFAEAARRFEEAIAANPNEAEYHAFLGWSIFNTNPEDFSGAEMAIEKIQTAISMNPTLESAHYFLGRIAMHGQQYPQAKAHFEKALQYNPTSKTASKELVKLDSLM